MSDGTSQHGNCLDDRLKDRNRQAQKKYRQKRKQQIQSTEERVAELEAQVKALSTDKVIAHPWTCICCPS
jgi:polyhydroxyalkanoate synthesis regulator phasin